MNTIRFGSLALLLLILLAGPASAQRAEEGEIAPDFTAATVTGEKVTLSKLRGKVVVINFWFIGCPPCREEIPGLNDLVAAFAGRDVLFLGLALDRKGPLDEFLAGVKFDYTIIPSSRRIASRYNVEGYPTHLIIERDGRIVKRMLGGGGIVPLMLRPVSAGLIVDSSGGR